MSRDKIGDLPYLQPGTGNTAGRRAREADVTASTRFVVDPELASLEAHVVRAVLRHRVKLAQENRWLAFPQRSCCYSFGANGLPLPIGALLLLWDTCPRLCGRCSDCEGQAYGFAFGGLLVVGGVIGVCLSCEKRAFARIGGFGRTLAALRPFLSGTEFYFNGGVFGNARASDGAELLSVLGGPR